MYLKLHFYMFKLLSVLNLDVIFESMISSLKYTYKWKVQYLDFIRPPHPLSPFLFYTFGTSPFPNAAD